MKNNYVSEIFSDVPSRWGLRGDPYFWEDLQRHFENHKLPYSVRDFETEVKNFFFTITGEQLTRECQVYVEKYAHGGMSSGRVDGSFWIDYGIPLLAERLKKIT